MNKNKSFLSRNKGILIFLAVMLVLPFIIGLFEGSNPVAVWNNQGTFSKHLEGIGIEIFILAIFALSYDLLFGVTGMMSFGHTMFFAVAAYTTGIALKSFSLPLWQVLLIIVGTSIVQAFLFSIVLPRVKGVTFTMVTLGMASMFHIIVMSSDMIKWTGADVGLQGVPKPAFIDPTIERLRFYVVALLILVLVYIFYKRFIDSPTGRVCVSIRENESRAKMLGYNTTIFKVVVMLIASFTASIAGVLHTLYQPIVSPTIADLGYTVTGLLIVLIGGIATQSGAIVGAFVIKLLDLALRGIMKDSAPLVTGVVYVIFVLFVPYGIVGSLKLGGFKIKQGWQMLLERFGLKKAMPKEE